MKKYNLKQKFAYRVMTLFLIMLVIVSMIPMGVFAEDTGAENPYMAKDFSAFYNYENDSVEFSWIAPEAAPYELWLCADEKLVKLDASKTEYTYNDAKLGENKFYLLSYKDGSDDEGVKSKEATVVVAHTLVSIEEMNAVTVDNDLELKDIIAKLPTTASVKYIDGDETKISTGHIIEWISDGVAYNKDAVEEQTISIKGMVALDETLIQNRNNVSLICYITVNVSAATGVELVTNIQDKYDVKTSDKLSLAVEVKGTVDSYQWYKKTSADTEGVAIKGATKAEFQIKNLKLGDSASYYCVVNGKDGSTVVSAEASVNVTKKTYFDKLHSTFIEKGGLNKILSGLGNTLIITAGALIIGVLIGVLIAVAKYFADDVPALKPVAWICDVYVTVIRGIPVTVLLIIFFFIIMATAKNGIVPAIITFGINSGAYMAEIIRSGINAVDKGQMEAGRSLGLSKMQTMTRIILPQAIRYILPAIGNEFIALLKETSVAGYVAVDDLTRAGQLVSANTFDVVNPRLLVAVIYLAIVVVLTQILSYFERRLAKNDKRK